MNIGVLGSIVWDVIDHPSAERVERWGGIAYSLAAAAAAVPEGWSIRPIVRVGSDLAASARRLLADIPALERPGGVLESPVPNNRVHLRYRDSDHRDERLEGGVPPWSWDELAPLVEGLDGLFVNLVSGFELDLETAERLRSEFSGLLYVDLHSLLLDVNEAGIRRPRPLAAPDRWLACFDVVQANERELELLADSTDPARLPHDAVAAGVLAFLVTRGPAGADWTARPDFHGAGAGRGPVDPAALVDGSAPVEPEPRRGDPTGCGDVWGATCFVELMRGSDITAAVRRANRAAARNVHHRGADGLYRHLKESP